MLSRHVLKLYICLAIKEGNIIELREYYGPLGCEDMHLTTLRHIRTHRTSYSRQLQPQTSRKLTSGFNTRRMYCSPNSASMYVSRSLVNAVSEFQPNTVATAKVSGFEFTSAQRTHRFYAKRAPHLPLVKRMLPRPPPPQDVMFNGVQAQLQQTPFNSKCPADENNFPYPHELGPLQLCQCAVRPIELSVTLATTNRFLPTVP
jgi:hypothetical protein